MPLSAAIFDMDGTLVDSVDLHARAWQEALARFGVQVPYDAVRDQIGKGADQLLPVFVPADRLDDEQEAIVAWRREHFKTTYLPQVRAFPDVRALFLRLGELGVRTAVASSANGDELDTYLALTDIGDLIEARTTADDAERSKPHPDIFEVALAELGQPSPAEVVVIGDSPYDAEAAGKAGLRTIGLLSGGFDEGWLREAGCIAIYRDPADLLARIDRSPLVPVRTRASAR